MKRQSLLILASIATLVHLKAAANPSNNLDFNKLGTANSASPVSSQSFGPTVPPIPSPQGGIGWNNKDGVWSYEGYITDYPGTNRRLEQPYKTEYTIDKDGQISVKATSKNGNDVIAWNFFKNGNLKSVTDSIKNSNGTISTKTWNWDQYNFFDYYDDNDLNKNQLSKFNGSSSTFNFYPPGLLPNTGGSDFGPNPNSKESTPYDPNKDPIPHAVPLFPEPIKGGNLINYPDGSKHYILNNITITNPINNKVISSDFEVSFNYDSNNHIKSINAVDNSLFVKFNWTFNPQNGELNTISISYPNPDNGQPFSVKFGHYSGDIYSWATSNEPENIFYARYPVTGGKKTDPVFNYLFPTDYTKAASNELIPYKSSGPENKVDNQPLTTDVIQKE